MCVHTKHVHRKVAPRHFCAQGLCKDSSPATVRVSSALPLPCATATHINAAFKLRLDKVVLSHSMPLQGEVGEGR